MGKNDQYTLDAIKNEIVKFTESIEETGVKVAGIFVVKKIAVLDIIDSEGKRNDIKIINTRVDCPDNFNGIEKGIFLENSTMLYKNILKLTRADAVKISTLNMIKKKDPGDSSVLLHEFLNRKPSRTKRNAVVTCQYNYNLPWNPNHAVLRSIRRDLKCLYRNIENTLGAEYIPVGIRYIRKTDSFYADLKKAVLESKVPDKEIPQYKEYLKNREKYPYITRKIKDANPHEIVLMEKGIRLLLELTYSWCSAASVGISGSSGRYGISKFITTHTYIDF